MKTNFTIPSISANKIIKSLPVSLLTLSLLTGCSEPPADITYPPKVSVTNGDVVIVRGTTKDPNNTSSVTVNGIDVNTDDGLATWNVSLPLDMGINDLTVETVNNDGKVTSSAASAKIERINTFLVDAAKGAIDSDNNRLLMVDDALNAVVAVDLTTGDQNVLSDTGTPDSINPLNWPTSIAIDRPNNRALVTDRSNYAVIAVDLSSGARTVLTNSSIPNGDNRLINPVDLVVDSGNNRALVLDQGANAIVSVDLSTGLRTVLSDNSIPNANNPFEYIDSIALDSLRNRLLVSDNTAKNIVAVDLTSGARTMFSGYSGFNFSKGLSIDEANDRVLTIDYNQKKVYAIDLTTGVVSVVTAESAESVFAHVRDLVVDPDNNRALVPDSLVDSVIAVDLETGQNSHVSHSLLGVDGVIGSLYGGLVLDKSNDRILVADDVSNSIVSVSLKTGKPTVFSDNTGLLPSDSKSFAVMSNLVIDEANQRALALERSASRNGVLQVDLKTGERTVFSNNSIPNTENPFENLEDIALDVTNHRALVVVSDKPGIYAVDLSTGSRTILSNNSIPDANTAFGNIITSIAVDADNNRAFVTDSTKDAIITVDLATGERSVFWEFNTPTVYERPEGIALDLANNRVLISAPGVDALIAIDLATKTKTVVSDSTVPDESNPLHEPGKITLDDVNDLAYVADRELGLVAIDLETGRRVVFAR